MLACLLACLLINCLSSVIFCQYPLYSVLTVSRKPFYRSPIAHLWRWHRRNPKPPLIYRNTKYLYFYPKCYSLNNLSNYLLLVILLTSSYIIPLRNVYIYILFTQLKRSQKQNILHSSRARTPQQHKRPCLSCRGVPSIFESALPYIDPSFFSTTITVFISIFISSPIFQFSIYSLSSLTTSSKSVISLRPLTCHMPVMPGLIASLAL